MNPTCYPSLIGFLDERVTTSYERLTRVVVGFCLFGRDRWLSLHDREATVGTVRRRRRLQAVDDLLAQMGGIAVLAYADIRPEFLPRGEIDGCADIPRMSRADNVWSQVSLSAVFAGVSWLQSSGVSLGTVDPYYDRKDLTRKHRIAFESALRAALPQIVRDAAAEYPSLFRADSSELRVGVISGVEKPRPAVSVDAFQHGTNFAHHFCSQTAAVISRGTQRRILVRDHTSIMHDMICKFTRTG